MKQKVFRTVLLIVSLSSIGYGFMRGETAVVFKKAINICLECIGIG